jgi:hypothetical protein
MLGRMAVCIKNLSGYLKATGIRNWNLLSAQSYALSGFFYGPHTYENSYGDIIHTVLKAEVKCPSCRLTANCVKTCKGINCRGSTYLTYNTSRYIQLTCGGSLTCLLYHSVQVPNDNIPKPGKTTTHPGSHRRGVNVRHRLPKEYKY